MPILSRPLLRSLTTVSRVSSSSSSSSYSHKSFSSVTTSTLSHGRSCICSCHRVSPLNNRITARMFSGSTYSSYGRDQVNGEPVDASIITPGRSSEKFAREHEQDYDADNVGYNTENDKKIKQSSSSYTSPDKNNASEEVMENENEGEYDNRGTTVSNDDDSNNDHFAPNQRVEREMELNSIPYTEHDNSALDGKMMSSSSAFRSPSSSTTSNHIPSPSYSEAIVHAEREFKDVDPLHIDLSSAAENNGNSKFDETTPLAEGQNNRDRSVRDDDNTTLHRMKRSREKNVRNDEEDLHTNIPSS